MINALNFMLTFWTFKFIILLVTNKLVYKENDYAI